ncbi:MAG: hypothetical protein GF400_01685, partial [Candidatus Eisenbacteria bacterium]|nr:hypothetical protein [Candidatus Eisenbacteria bacterium]
MRHVLPALLVASLLTSPAAARVDEAPSRAVVPPGRQGTIVWYDDLDTGAPGWTHGDLTADAEPRFHVDAHNAWDDGTPADDYSWWCGVLDAGYPGGDGYGNDWNERLELPPIELGTSVVEHTSWGAIKAMYLRPDERGRLGHARAGDLRRDERPGHRRLPEPTPAEMPRRDGRPSAPVLTFSYRHDSEPGYDFTWVEVESAGAWVALNEGYDGSSGGWQEADELPLSGYGDPVNLRFRFRSDGAYSDADGLYDSDGGAFSVDNIRVFDSVTGEVHFLDACDGGVGLCTPLAPEPAGDYWHLEATLCRSYSPPHAWSVAWPETTYVQPNLRNWLQTPVIDASDHAWSDGCTAFAVIRMYMAPHWGGYWAEESSTDGGQTWVRRNTWCSHQCTWGYDACQPFLDTVPVWDYSQSGSAQVAVRWIVYT